MNTNKSEYQKHVEMVTDGILSAVTVVGIAVFFTIVGVIVVIAQAWQ